MSYNSRVKNRGILLDGSVTLKSRTWQEKLSTIILPLDGGGLRRELSRTIKVGVNIIWSPLPLPSPTREEGIMGLFPR